MTINKTKRLTLDKALKILQLRYGTQVQTVIKQNNIYIVDSISNEKQGFSRGAILALEEELYG